MCTLALNTICGVLGVLYNISYYQTILNFSSTDLVFDYSLALKVKHFLICNIFVEGTDAINNVLQFNY